jgi:hypothetical protein
LIRCRFAILSITLFCLIPANLAWSSPKAAAPAVGVSGSSHQSADNMAAQLEGLSGEYTNQADPGTPLSFYVQNGKLVMESNRHVPTELKTNSATEFGIPDSKVTLKFTVDAAGHGETVTMSADPDAHLRRTGDAVHHLFHDYQRTEAMVPARDGVKLHVVILKPADINGPLPFLIQRTPYGCDETNRASFSGGRPELARAGYIYVCGDIRGRYKSEGEFMMNRPLADHHDAKAVDESTDAFDTVSWLLTNVSGNNGRAGFIGTSYPGFTAIMGGIDPHPAVKAISPQAPMIDAWLGDDFFHNGAFRQTYGYDYGLMMETNKEDAKVDYGKDKDGKPVDGYDFFLERGSFMEDVKKSGSKMLPTWERFIQHPAYDEVWRSHGVEYDLHSVAVPTLTVGGYYDQEDMWGAQEEYNVLEPFDTKHINFLVEGPWRHGSWASSSWHLGNIQYGEPIGDEFRSQIEAKFFAHYLKDEPGQDKAGFDLEDTASFQTGSNTWKRYSHFPPKEAQVTSLYLQGDGKLSWNDSTAAAKTSYVSDPANPVPYRHRPIQPTYGPGSQWYTWLTEDQRFVSDRKDVAVWKLPVLKKDMIVTGEVVADIFAATTGTDNDMVVKLIDQYPEDDPDPTMRGYQLMTNDEIFRGRYLQGFDKPTPLRADSVHEYKFSLHDVDHVFKAGHTVIVEVQSTWFPLYDRNPQTYVANIMLAKPEDYKAATITVYSDPEHDSTLQVPLMNACDQIDCF